MALTITLHQIYILTIALNVFSAFSLYRLSLKEKLYSLSYIPALFILTFTSIVYSDIELKTLIFISISITIFFKLIILLLKNNLDEKNIIFAFIISGVLFIIPPIHDYFLIKLSNNIISTSISLLFTFIYFFLNFKNNSLKISLKVFLPLIAIIISNINILEGYIYLAYILLIIYIYIEVHSNFATSKLNIQNYEEKFKKIEEDFHYEVQKAVKTRTFHVERIKDKIAEVNRLDHLTKALTRKAIVNAVDFLIMSKKSEKFIFLMFDIDKFKNINDTFGHIQGDVCLKLLVTIAKQNLREIDMIGRYGGDEFIIILPNQDLETGLTVANRFRKKVAETTSPHFTVSIGVSAYPWDGKTFKELLDVADKGLYLSKENGRNAVNYDGYLKI